MEQEKKNLVQVGDTFFQSATIKELIEKKIEEKVRCFNGFNIYTNCVSNWFDFIC